MGFIHNHPIGSKIFEYGDVSFRQGDNYVGYEGLYKRMIELPQPRYYTFYLLNNVGELKRRPNGQPNEVPPSPILVSGLNQGQANVTQHFDYGNKEKRVGPIGFWGNLKPK